jgi:hypothetical protein
MKNKILLFSFLVFILSSCYHQWVFRPEIKGYVFDYETKKPISAILYFLPVVGENFTDTIRADINGVFKFSKISSKEWALPSLEKPKSPPNSNKIIIKYEKYINDTIDYTEIKIENNIIYLDTVFLKRMKKIL